MPVYIGLDIGGTKLMAAAADGTGRLLRRMRESGGFCITPQKSAVGLKPLFCLRIDAQKSETSANQMAQNVQGDARKPL
jgi:hypothetical protein